MKWKRTFPILLVLLLAFLLRTYALTATPPGLTHDEANHGREALEILSGRLALFFPLNYGSEPLYSYFLALFLGVGGRNMLALRLVNVFFGLLTVAATFLWSRLAFSYRVGLLAAALMALSFWPVAAGREALRAGMMPLFTVGAMLFYWLILREASRQPAGARFGIRNRRLPGYIVAFALCLISALYNYLAARVFWLIFPLFLVYLALFHRPVFRRSWRPTLVGLLLVGLAVIPLALYLAGHPESQTRLDMLDSVIQQALGGNPLPLVTNISRALLAFVWPGMGDQFLAYNIPGRPVFEFITAAFFLLGVAVCLRRRRKPAYVLLLLWFLVGIIPSLVTGPTANTTRNVGAYVPTFILPAIGFVALARSLQKRTERTLRPLIVGAAVVWLCFVLVNTATDYFLRWGRAADVRAAYQHTLIEALDYIVNNSVEGTTIVSSVYPGPAHNPSIGLVAAGPDVDMRWVDARLALIFPADGRGRLVTMAATPLHSAFENWVEFQLERSLRPDDLNPGFSVYRLMPPMEWFPGRDMVTFGENAPALELIGHEWLSDSVRPGETAELMQVWRVIDPAGVGPIVFPSNTTDAVLFTHVLNEDGTIMAQRDSLEAPSWDWQAGDTIVQIHPVAIPENTAPGSYQVVVGVFDRAGGKRLPLWNSEGAVGETRAFLLPLEVEQP